MGFRANGPAHTMFNPFDEELVYLLGGERVENLQFVIPNVAGQEMANVSV